MNRLKVIIVCYRSVLWPEFYVIYKKSLISKSIINLYGCSATYHGLQGLHGLYGLHGLQWLAMVRIHCYHVFCKKGQQIVINIEVLANIILYYSV